jgi:hypothetical protein
MLVTSTTSAVPLPPIFVPKEMISDRVNRFLQTKHNVLSDQLTGTGPSRMDTRSIWYSKEHVQTWLDEINLMGADGMRVYFGAYGPENEDAEGQLCLLMVLTKSDNGLHKDIILEDEAPERMQETRKLRSILTEDGDKGKKKPKEYNYGSPCPPICPDSNEQAFPL